MQTPTIAEAARLIASRKLSPVELTQHCLSRIEAEDPVLHAFIRLTPDPDHFTSGSSSGTGAAIAAGLILGGTGSDTGGSIRGPAAFCGIAGIKPTYGLCSRYGVLPLSFSLDHTGPMAWTVEDCALLLQ